MKKLQSDLGESNQYQLDPFVILDFGSGHDAFHWMENSHSEAAILAHLSQPEDTGGAYARSGGGGGGGKPGGTVTPPTIPAAYLSGDANVDDAQEFNIKIVFDEASWTANQIALVKLAADKWSHVIKGDITGVGSIDDIEITVDLVDIDGKGSRIFGNILTEAFTDANRAAGDADQYLPYQSHINFDAYDFADGMRTDADFLGLIMHEIGHALGFIDQTFSLFGQALLDANGNFIGANALAAYSNGTAVPLDAAGDHWDNFAFAPNGQSLQNELMTGVQVKGETVVLSDTTLGVLTDLGYEVDPTLLSDSVSTYTMDML